MKLAPFCTLAALGLLALCAGCQNLDLAPEGDPRRVVTGNVVLAGQVLFPPETVAIVRVLDPGMADRPAAPVGTELPVADRNRPEKIERVLGEQVIRAPGTAPFAFRVEFEATDAQLRHGLNVDVRISHDGRVQYRTLNAHAVTLSSLRFPHEVSVDPVRR